MFLQTRKLRSKWLVHGLVAMVTEPGLSPGWPPRPGLYGLPEAASREGPGQLSQGSSDWAVGTHRGHTLNVGLLSLSLGVHLRCPPWSLPLCSPEHMPPGAGPRPLSLSEWLLAGPQRDPGRPPRGVPTEPRNTSPPPPSPRAQVLTAKTRPPRAHDPPQPGDGASQHLQP